MSANNEILQAYGDGFKDGWEAAFKLFGSKLGLMIEDAAKTLSFDNPVVPTETYKFQEGCPVCGIGKNGDPLGYACQHPACPSRVTFSNMMVGGIANCDTTTTNTLSGL